MILPLAILIILVQVPVWLLLIVTPGSALAKRVTSNYAVFILIGILYIFLAIGVLVYALSFNSTIINALASVPENGTQVTADAMKPILDALRLSANIQPTLLGVLLGTTVLDLAGGILASRDLAAMDVRPSTRRGLLLLMFLLGPAGMLVYGTWHYLNVTRAASRPQ
jgi:hypothetical protein